MASPLQYDALRRALDGRPLPALVCDLDAFDTNLAALVKRASPRPLRVASKSVRCRALLRRALEHDGVEGLMCFRASEAVHLAAHGFDDLLVAYPTTQPEEVRAVCEVVARGIEVTLMVDHRDQVELLARVAREADVVLRVCMDVDMSSAFPGVWFGVRRSPVRDRTSALELASAVDAHGHLRLHGVMGYEAQLAGLPDRSPGWGLRASVVRRLKARSRREVIGRRADVVRALRDAGFDLGLVNGGGTGSLEFSASDPSLTEVTAGSGLFSPVTFDHFDAFKHEPALMFALPVVRKPVDGVVTCAGGGYVASGPAGRDRLPSVVFPRGAKLLPDEGAGEVQTPVELGVAAGLRIGDPVFFRHAKAGEVCERFNHVYLLSGDDIVDEVTTYRGDGVCFG